jgi:hypothetical protein
VRQTVNRLWAVLLLLTTVTWLSAAALASAAEPMADAGAANCQRASGDCAGHYRPASHERLWTAR